MDNDKFAKLRALPQVSPPSAVKTNPSTVPGHSNGVSYQEVKDKAITKAVALNNACILTDAYARAMASTDALKGMSHDQVRGLLQSLKKSEFSDNWRLLTGKDDEEIPF